MKENEEWQLFERLTDPDLPEEEKLRLEREIASDPEVQARYEAFCILQDWPTLENQESSAAARERLLARIAEEQEDAVTDRELGRLFPIFISGALAAALALAMVNFWEFGDTSEGTLDALFGMPEESEESVIVSQL
ncbi:hypothetical protein [Pelagicoccus mobilis]|uniref:Uncharacterized protein n=1 Tax=Pelagicoccus mobilis TaxID=415221 RepID=A0A934S460_9BACT|nr:hypothetical protein [Pelagicoccus mobilis]MBK1878703.1 hypothetical protein [Pelagicoccus mobilis]